MSKSMMKHIDKLESQIRAKDRRIADLESALRYFWGYHYGRQEASEQFGLGKMRDKYRATIESVLEEIE